MVWCYMCVVLTYGMVLQRHVLASASADKTVKIWDVPRASCLHTLTHHTDKVPDPRP